MTTRQCGGRVHGRFLLAAVTVVDGSTMMPSPWPSRRTSAMRGPGRLRGVTAAHRGGIPQNAGEGPRSDRQSAAREPPPSQDGQVTRLRLET